MLQNFKSWQQYHEPSSPNPELYIFSLICLTPCAALSARRLYSSEIPSLCVIPQINPFRLIFCGDLYWTIASFFKKLLFKKHSGISTKGTHVRTPDNCYTYITGTPFLEHQKNVLELHLNSNSCFPVRIHLNVLTNLSFYLLHSLKWRCHKILKLSQWSQA